MEGNVVRWGSAKKGDPQLGGAGSRGGWRQEELSAALGRCLPRAVESPGRLQFVVPEEVKEIGFRKDVQPEAT